MIVADGIRRGSARSHRVVRADGALVSAAADGGGGIGLVGVSPARLARALAGASVGIARFVGRRAAAARAVGAGRAALRSAGRVRVWVMRVRVMRVRVVGMVGMRVV